MIRELDDADLDLLNDLWAGALFDVIHKVMTERPGWSQDEQTALICVAIRVLAEQLGIIEDDES